MATYVNKLVLSTIHNLIAITRQFGISKLKPYSYRSRGACVQILDCITIPVIIVLISKDSCVLYQHVMTEIPLDKITLDNCQTHKNTDNASHSCSEFTSSNVLISLPQSFAILRNPSQSGISKVHPYGMRSRRNGPYWCFWFKWSSIRSSETFFLQHKFLWLQSIVVRPEIHFWKVNHSVASGRADNRN